MQETILKNKVHESLCQNFLWFELNYIYSMEKNAHENWNKLNLTIQLP